MSVFFKEWETYQVDAACFESSMQAHKPALQSSMKHIAVNEKGECLFVCLRAKAVSVKN